MSSNLSLKDFLDVGAHFGHQVRRWNPKMNRYIYEARGGVHVFDLAKTKAGLDEACTFLSDLIAAGKIVLFVGTKRQAADIVKREAERVGVPYMTVRWVGGLLTNWNQLSSRIRLLTEMKQKRATGEYKKYTKYEQLQLDRKITKLQKTLGGVESLAKLPDAIFVVDTHAEAVAVAEANVLNIPVVGMVDTNADPDRVKFVIPTNDDATGAIDLVVTAVAESVVTAKSKAEAVQAKQAEEARKAEAKAAKTKAVKDLSQAQDDK